MISTIQAVSTTRRFLIDMSLDSLMWPQVCLVLVCWSLTSLCHSNHGNGHIETMPARKINPFTALTRIRSQLLRTQWSTSNHQGVSMTALQTAQPSGLVTPGLWLMWYQNSNWSNCSYKKKLYLYLKIINQYYTAYILQKLTRISLLHSADFQS